MGSRGSASGGGAKVIAGATRVADRAVSEFLDRENGMASDGEINGVYESAFVKEAKRLGATKLQINNALNKNLKTTDKIYVK